MLRCCIATLVPAKKSYICRIFLIGGDIFLDFTLVAVIEAVADLINLYIIDHLGRKTNLVFV